MDDGQRFRPHEPQIAQISQNHVNLCHLWNLWFVGREALRPTKTERGARNGRAAASARLKADAGASGVPMRTPWLTFALLALPAFAGCVMVGGEARTEW